MSDYGWHDWPAQDPPDDFVDRTAAAMIRADRASSGRSRSRRWILVGVLAAAFANAAAWAMVAHQRRLVPEPVAVGSAAVSALVAPARSVRALTGPMPAAETSSEPSSVPLVKPAPTAGRRKVPPAASSSAPATSSRPPLVPRCDCAEGVSMCTCLE